MNLYTWSMGVITMHAMPLHNNHQPKNINFCKDMKMSMSQPLYKTQIQGITLTGQLFF